MDDSAVHDLTCPESVGLCIPFFYYMWLNTSKRHKGRKTALLDDEVAFKLNIPDTIIYNFQKPQHWYFTSKSSDPKEKGTIRRRKRINMSSQRIIEHFLPPRSKSGVAAVVFSPAISEADNTHTCGDGRRDGSPAAEGDDALIVPPPVPPPASSAVQRLAPEKHAISALTPLAQSVVARVHEPPSSSFRISLLPSEGSDEPIPPDRSAYRDGRCSTNVVYLDDQGMRQHVERSVVQAGVLQPFIDPRPGSDEVVRATTVTARWQPSAGGAGKAVSQYDVVESLLPLFPKDGKAWSDRELQERAASSTAPLWRTRMRGVVSRVVCEEVGAVCERVALHLRKVADVVVRSMTLHFVIDARSTLWLSYCSAMSVLPTYVAVPPNPTREGGTVSASVLRAYQSAVDARREVALMQLYGKEDLSGADEVTRITQPSQRVKRMKGRPSVPEGVDPYLAQFATATTLKRLAAVAQGGEGVLIEGGQDAGQAVRVGGMKGRPQWGASLPPGSTSQQPKPPRLPPMSGASAGAREAGSPGAESGGDVDGSTGAFDGAGGRGGHSHASGGSRSRHQPSKGGVRVGVLLCVDVSEHHRGVLSCLVFACIVWGMVFLYHLSLSMFCFLFVCRRLDGLIVDILSFPSMIVATAGCGAVACYSR